MTEHPYELVDLACRISQQPGFVQGAGGNISFKNEDRMWVKASGTRLSEAESRNIFVELDLAVARDLASTSEDFSTAVIRKEPPENLRPSIETSLHSLMPHAWVAHVHSVGLLGLLICDGELPELDHIVPSGTRLIDVPYVKPGLRLSQAVFNQLDLDFGSETPAVILLRNHGFVVASNDRTQLLDILAQVELSARPKALPSGRLTSPSPLEPGWTKLLPATSVSGLQATMLSAGPYTPDETVFLGAKPFAFVDQLVDTSEVDESTLFVILTDGSVWARSDAPQDAVEIGLSAVDFVSAVRPESNPRPLSIEEIDELIHWDAEKWRKAQQK